MIVIHHTGNPADDDLSAEQIHASHLALGWSGIGYHYVIRKDGTVEIGRPEWSVGAHAYGHNCNTIGIMLCGNFEYATPTIEQIEAVSALVAWLAEKYEVSISDETVIGHRDLIPTVCPGKNLYSELRVIRGKAIWYQQHYKDGRYDGK